MAEESKPMSSSRVNVVADMYFGSAEKTVTESSYDQNSYLRPYNTDDLWQKTGDYTLYEAMGFDDQVSVAMQLKKDLVIGSGWDITVEQSGDSAIRDDIYQRLEEDVEVNFEDQLEELIDNAYSYGFACSEKLFRMRDDNTLSFKELRTRHPNTWRLHTDKHGRMEKYEQMGSDDSVAINPKSLIHMINQGKWQNPYGRSDLRAAYEAWMTKRHIIRFYAIFLEKHASPTPYAKYDKKAPKDKVLEIFNIIKKFQTKTAMVFPKEFEVDFLESKSNGDAYTKGINLFNMFIGRSLTIPDLLGFSGSESQSGGSQALGREQMTVFSKHIERRRRSLERIVNKHIVQPLVTWNYGQVELFPKFVLKPLSDDKAIEYAKIFLEAVKGNAYKPNDEEINHFRTLIKFPEGAVEHKEAAPSPFFESPGIPGKDSPPEDEIESDGDLPEEEGAKKKEFKAYLTPKDELSKKIHKRLNVPATKALLEANHQKLLAELAPVTEEIFEDLKEQIRKKKILGEKPHPERIDSIKIKNLSKMNAVLKRNLKSHYKDSQILARQELPRQVFNEPMPTEEFLNYLDQDTFDYIGDWEYRMSQFTREELKRAIRDGLPLSTVEGVMDTDGKRLSDTSLERYSRTKHTEVMNYGRQAEFEASGVVSGFLYSAIMDGRTTEICRGLHGKKFKKGTEPIPPMHFNCRSLLIPITIFDDKEAQKFPSSSEQKKTDKFIEKNKGKGFAKR